MKKIGFLLIVFLVFSTLIVNSVLANSNRQIPVGSGNLFGHSEISATQAEGVTSRTPSPSQIQGSVRVENRYSFVRLSTGALITQGRISNGNGFTSAGSSRPSGSDYRSNRSFSYHNGTIGGVPGSFTTYKYY